MLRNKKTEKQKKIRLNIETYFEVRAQRDIYEKLETPIHHGYYIEYVFDEDKYGRHKDAAIIRNLIDTCFRYGWCVNKDFTIRKKKGRYVENILPKQVFLSKKQIDSFSEEELKYVRPCNVSKHGYYCGDLMKFIKTKRSKAYITERRIVDSERESYLTRMSDEIHDNIDDYAFEYCYGERNSKITKLTNRHKRRGVKQQILKSLNTSDFTIDSYFFEKDTPYDYWYY